MADKEKKGEKQKLKSGSDGLLQNPLKFFSSLLFPLFCWPEEFFLFSRDRLLS
jgi:hypothetical protein